MSKEACASQDAARHPSVKDTLGIASFYSDMVHLEHCAQWFREQTHHQIRGVFPILLSHLLFSAVLISDALKVLTCAAHQLQSWHCTIGLST